MSSLMPSATVLLVVGHLLGTQAQLSGSGKTTRYWDCCKPSCAWNGKGPFSRPVATCAKDGVSVQSDINLQSGCSPGGSAYTCNNNQPWAVNTNLAYGFAAAQIAGSNEQAWCCTCMELTFTTTSIAGKKMIVQVTNTGADLNHAPNHFDLQIPGGGMGLFNGCSSQWGAPPNGWGQLYGGVGSKAECSQLPSQLQAGCFFRFEWFQGADNPDMTFKEVACPAELLARSQCSRGGPVPPPPPPPGIQWQTGPDGVWARGCDFPGQDLSSAQVQGAQCSGTCKATAGCTHFAWTDFNGGTCWMKSGNRFKQDAVASNNPSIVCGINGGGITWNGDWANGCDFKGQDFASATVPGNQCGPTCLATAGCTHYTWTNFNGGTCWMKNGPVTRADAFATGDAAMVCGVIPGTVNAKFNTEAISFTPGADGVWAMQCDFPGQDLSSAQVPGDQCSGKCKQTTGCTHYAWTNFNGGTCWMKSGARTQADAISVADPTAVCGINTGAASNGINWNGNWATGCDFNGQDLSSANVPGDQCSNKCAATAGCTHYTWTSFNGGTCWMKSGAATKADAIPASDPSAVCGVLGPIPPPGPGPIPTPLPSGRGIAVINNCKMPIWVAVGTNSNSAPLGVGEVQLAPGANKVYNIGAAGWAGRMWPKFGCDANGLNCDFGQSSNPCSGGCHPPADTKVEFNIPPSGQVWYDISLVDGYSLPVKITPNANLGGSCVETTCNLQMSDCPSNENSGLGDLHVNRNGKQVACLSPCKKWNYPAPFGLGQSEQTPNGHAMCCPTPPVSSPQCRAGPVVNTQFVNLVRSKCPSAYSFAYDDMAGLHACSAQTGFTVTFCPV